MVKTDEKIEWCGKLIGVQPRIRLTRSFDHRDHSYLGYSLRVRSAGDGGPQEFLIGVGKAAHAKHGFRVGDIVRGRSAKVGDPRSESVDFYKTSALVVESRKDEIPDGLPWQGVAPELSVYRKRGHRRLSARTYGSKCSSCAWACQMPVEMIVDHWNPRVRRYRYETFCYGPKSCPLYSAGPTRKVPGRQGMTWEEEDWVDEDATAHRSLDE